MATAAVVSILKSSSSPKLWKYQIYPSSNNYNNNNKKKKNKWRGGLVCCVSPQFGEANGLKLVLHDALDSSGIDTRHARGARDGFCSQIQKLTQIERETSIAINRRVDLGEAALYIAAEDDSLISHSCVPLPVDEFLKRLDDHSMNFCSQYSTSMQSSPENFLKGLETYLYIDKGFRRTTAKQADHRALYLPSVLTHRLGSVTMLSLIYSEILKMLRLWGLLDFDVEIFYPHDPHSLPRGYDKQRSSKSDQLHIMTSQSLLVEVLRNLKSAFWPFQRDNSESLFLRAASAANCSGGSNSVELSAYEVASAKAAQHRLERGVWTSVRFGDMRRALSACERLILLETDPRELRDYGALLYHGGFYEEALHFLEYYQEAKKSLSIDSFNTMEEDALEKLIIRLNLIMMEDRWTRPSNSRSFLTNNSEPW